jgi:CDP-diacylglycerol--glycerol-3-phosphate 3-phosphatidyltransferase
MKQSSQNSPKTLTDFLRSFFRGVLEAVAGVLNTLRIPANAITILGVFGNGLAGFLISIGHLFWGGLVALLVGPLDAVDGTMARLQGKAGPYGALMDSVVDRYSEIALYAGLLVFYNRAGTWGDALLVFFAAVGSIMVSYVRARAESLGYSAKIGLLTRAERYIVLIPGILIGAPHISLWILAILTHVTAWQRFWFVRRHIRQSNSSKELKKENLDD